MTVTVKFSKYNVNVENWLMMIHMIKSLYISFSFAFIHLPHTFSIRRDVMKMQFHNSKQRDLEKGIPIHGHAQ